MAQEGGGFSIVVLDRIAPDIVFSTLCEQAFFVEDPDC